MGKKVVQIPLVAVVEFLVTADSNASARTTSIEQLSQGAMPVSAFLDIGSTPTMRVIRAASAVQIKPNEITVRDANAKDIADAERAEEDFGVGPAHDRFQ